MAEPEANYFVRKRKWPFKPPLKRPWEIIRRADGKPVTFLETEEEADRVCGNMNTWTEKK